MEGTVGAREIDVGIVVAGFISSQQPNGGSYLALIDEFGFFADVENPVEGNSKVNLKAYPNPFSNMLNIEIGNASIGGVLNIYDLKGALIFSDRVNASSQAISLSHFASGMYILEYRGGDFQNILHSQMIIKH